MHKVWTDERERLRMTAMLLEHLGLTLDISDNEHIKGFSKEIISLAGRMHSFDAKCLSRQVPPKDVPDPSWV
jgi:hypothetical protein